MKKLKNDKEQFKMEEKKQQQFSTVVEIAEKTTNYESCNISVWKKLEILQYVDQIKNWSRQQSTSAITTQIIDHLKSEDGFERIPLLRRTAIKNPKEFSAHVCASDDNANIEKYSYDWTI